MFSLYFGSTTLVVAKLSFKSNELFEFESIFSPIYFLVFWFFLFKGGIIPLLEKAGDYVSIFYIYFYAYFYAYFYCYFPLD